MNSEKPNRWMVLVLAVWMQAVTIGIGTYSFAFFVVPWMEEFRVDRGTLMLAATGATIGTAILSPFCGYLLDRVASVLLVVAGGSVMAAGLVAAAFAPNAILVILIFVLLVPFGLVLAGTLMASSLVARAFNERRGLALGISALGTSLGGVLMPPLVTWILANHDWRTLFLVLAAVVVVFVLLPAACILGPDGRAMNRAIPPPSPGLKFDVKLSPAVLRAGYAFLAPAMLFVAVLHNLGALAEDSDISQQHAAWIVSAASVLMAISKVVFGMLSDRTGCGILYVAAILCQYIGVTLIWLAHGFGLLLVGVSLVAVGAGGMLPIISSLVASRWGPERFGSIMGVVLAFVGLSGLGPMFAGVIRDASGSYDFAFATLATLLVPAAWSLLMLSSSISSGRTRQE